MAGRSVQEVCLEHRPCGRCSYLGWIAWGWGVGMDSLHGSQELSIKRDLSVACHWYRALQVAMKFPSTEVQLLITASEPPRLTIQPSGLSLDPALETQAFVVLQNSSLVPLFQLHMVSWVGTQIQAQILWTLQPGPRDSDSPAHTPTGTYHQLSSVCLLIYVWLSFSSFSHSFLHGIKQFPAACLW